MMELQMMLTYLRAHRYAVQHTTRDEHDKGADIIQTVIIVAAFAAAAIVIASILVAKAKSAANNIKTQ
jgi:hypothetical protein